MVSPMDAGVVVKIASVMCVHLLGSSRRVSRDGCCCSCDVCASAGIRQVSRDDAIPV